MGKNTAGPVGILNLEEFMDKVENVFLHHIIQLLLVIHRTGVYIAFVYFFLAC